MEKDKISQLLKKLKRHGIIKCMGRVFDDIAYGLYKFVYKKSNIDENQVLFVSTPSFSDNSKVMYEYLLNNQSLTRLHFVWLIDRRELHFLHKNTIDLLERTQFIEINTLFHRKETLKVLDKIASSKYIFFTHNSPVRHIKDGQIVINLWHGCGYKDVEKTSKPWCYSNPFDYALVPGKVFIDTKKKFWGCSKNKIIPIGYPRYDLLLSPNEKAGIFAKKISGVAKKLIVWMPTFRKTKGKAFTEESVIYSFDLPLLQSHADVKQLNQYCKEKNVMVCIKRHPFQIEYSCEHEQYSNIMFISNEDFVKAEVELYSFLHYTDALISDYSSVAIDYLLLSKPIAFALGDFIDYKLTRGFVFKEPLNYMPGHHLYTLEDMLIFIDDIAEGMDPYAKDRKAIMPNVHNYCDNYCERIWIKIQELEFEKKGGR